MTEKEIDAYDEISSDPAYDLSKDEIYLGCVTIGSGDEYAWIWEGKPPGFSDHNIEELHYWISNFADTVVEVDNCDDNIFSISPSMPEPSEEFTIGLGFHDWVQLGEVTRWHNTYHIDLGSDCVILTKMDDGRWKQLNVSLLEQSTLQAIVDELEKRM